MNKEKIMQTLEHYKQSLERDGHKVLYIGLYGSNNYGLDDEYSDIDAKAIVMPTLEDIVFKKVISNVREFEDGAVDYKDLITFYNVVKKGNFSFTEPFHSEYYIGNEYLRFLFSQIETNLMGVMGGMMEKRKALTHEYPSKVEMFAKYHCDPKQFHHILRLYDLLFSSELTANPVLPYLDYSGSEVQQFMTKIKREMCGYTLEEMIAEADQKIAEVKDYLKGLNYKYQEQNFDKEITDFLTKELKKLLTLNQ